MQEENDTRKRTAKAVVTDVKLEKKFEMDKASRDDTGETIGVYVKESKVLEEPELFRQATGYVGVVQVYAGDRQDERVIRGWGTIDTSVVAYMWPKPVGCKLVGIGGHSMFP